MIKLSELKQRLEKYPEIEKPDRFVPAGGKYLKN